MPVPSIMIGLIDTVIGASNSFAARTVNFIMIRGPIQMIMSNFSLARNSFKGTVQLPSLPYEPSSVITTSLFDAVLNSSSSITRSLFLNPIIDVTSAPILWNSSATGSAMAVSYTHLFLYGMRVMGDGLKQGSTGALKKAMAMVTGNPLLGFLLGFVVTGIIQSSHATIVLTSGLVGAGDVYKRQGAQTMEKIKTAGKGGEKYTPFNERTGNTSDVFFTSDLSADGLRRIFAKVNNTLNGKVAVKIHTGEQHGPNIIPSEWVKERRTKDIKNGALIETNTY